MLAGVPDPIAFLSHEGIEWDIACVTMEEVMTRKVEARRDELKAIIAALASRIGAEIGRHTVVLG